MAHFVLPCRYYVVPCCAAGLRGVQITSDETGMFDRFGWRFYAPMI